jgi:hypothetical protein
VRISLYIFDIACSILRRDEDFLGREYYGREGSEEESSPQIGESGDAILQDGSNDVQGCEMCKGWLIEG